MLGNDITVCAGLWQVRPGYVR